MSSLEQYAIHCQRTASELGRLAKCWIFAGDADRAGHFARVAARNAFVVLGLRVNRAAEHPVQVVS